MIELSEVFSQDLLKQLGIIDFGITNEPIAKSYKVFENWVLDGKNAELKYLEGSKMKAREDLRNYFPEFKTAFVFLFDYSNEKNNLEKFYQSSDSNGLKVASYTLIDDGEDYHLSIRRKLETLSSRLRDLKPEVKTLFSLDTQPILERDLAYRAGLGWFGRNSMLINKKYGSFFLIGSILCDADFSSFPTVIDNDHCGTCTACVDACPTNAIDYQTRTVDSSLCIPYFTIEKFKDDTEPPKGFSDMNEIFGCDICQDVCPWNRKSLSNESLEGEVNQKIKDYFLINSPNEIMERLNNSSKKGYRRELAGTSFERTGRDGLLKNIKYKK